MTELLAASSLMALVALTALEIVLGVDNLVFIAILTGRLPPEHRAFARKLGLAMAAIGRIVLLLAASWVITLDQWTLIHLERWGLEITIRDAILIAGGAFLLAKATWEIHESIEGDMHHPDATPKKVSVANVIGQILLLDLVFSIDSVLTAVAMVEPGNPEKFSSAPIPFTTVPWPAMAIMSAAVLTAVAVMLFFITPVSNFIERHPTVKMLALAFLLLIGMVLIADGFHQHIPRGYIYFAMGFSIFVEMLNIKAQGGARRVTDEHDHGDRGERIWRDLFTKWPKGIAHRGVVVSTLNEATPFKGFMLRGDMLLLERTNPDSLGTRFILMSFDAIHMVKWVDPLSETALNGAGFVGQLAKA